MLKEEDLYLGDKKSYHNDRKSYHSKRAYHRKKTNKKYKNRRSGKGISILFVFLLAIILGIATFYMTNKHLNENDDTIIGQDARRKGNTHNEVEVDENLSTDNDMDVTKVDVEENSEEFKEDDQPFDTSKGEKIEEFMIDFVDTRTPVKVKGIYVTGPRAGSKEYMDELIGLVDTTELNAMVIDIKNDSGEITYKMQIDDVIGIGAGVNYISDINGLIKELKEHDIYLIARIVAFKDPLLAEKKPELSLMKKNGKSFKDKNGFRWVNPYKKEVWEYLLNVAKEAVNLGFDEIQFDYIRFATESSMKEVNFGEEAVNITKKEIITEFTKYACEQLKPLGVYVSADVYGTIIDSKVDAEIVGQSYTDMAKYLDYIYPMIYPSHYADGAYGIQYPDTKPYDLILNVLNKSRASLKELNNYDNIATVRPWLQDFTAKWLKNHIKYGPEEIRAQISGVYDAGYEEWILWNGSNNYTKEGLLNK